MRDACTLHMAYYLDHLKKIIVNSQQTRQVQTIIVEYKHPAYDLYITTNRLGWQSENKNLEPVLTELDAAPPKLIKIIRCGCKSWLYVLMQLQASSPPFSAICTSCMGTGCCIDEISEVDDEETNVTTLADNVVLLIEYDVLAIM